MNVVKEVPENDIVETKANMRNTSNSSNWKKRI